MQLDRESLAAESLENPVDLHRLHREIVESFADEVTGYEEPTVGQAISLTHQSTYEIRQRVQGMTYDQLKNRQWVQVIGLDPVRSSAFLDAMDGLESMIDTFGSVCQVNQRPVLQALCDAWSTHYPALDPIAFPSLLAETAVNQTLDRRSIGRVEMTIVRNQVDRDLARENEAIVEMVRDSLLRLMNSSEQ